ncbi:MAG TPA: acetolactate synthase small subunit [Acidobacteriota bacterium]|nr:acetolactate synthase small subunit [Acidobacteriota bacterium]
MAQILSLLVRNKAGVLAQVVSLFSRQGCNIESLNVASTSNHDRARVTIAIETDQSKLDQIVSELSALADVISVIPYDPHIHVVREMALVRVRIREENRAEVLALSEVFRARVVDASPHSYIFEVTGQSEKVDAFLQNMSVYGISEVHRTGKLALTRSTAEENAQPVMQEQGRIRNGS